MARNRFTLAVAFAVMVMAGAPQAAVAGDSLPLGSSLTPECVGAAGAECSLIDFTLNLEGEPAYEVLAFYLDIEDSVYGTDWLYSVDGTTPGGTAFQWVSLWQSGVYIDDMAFNIEGGDLVGEIAGLGGSNTSPLTFRIGFDQSLTDGNYEGWVYGGTARDADGVQYSYNGNVTPEPISMLLMGTGLLGVGVVGAARRKKNQLG